MDPYVARIIPLAIMCGTALAGLTIVVTAITLRRRREVSPASADLRMRLERIEHAVDAIAIEVERISEGQRFTSKLLADRDGAVVPRPSSKVVTPH